MRTDGLVPISWHNRILLVGVTLVVATLVLLFTQPRLASGENGEEGLGLTDVTYEVLDTDTDGYSDGVMVNASVHNSDEFRSKIFVLKAGLTIEGNEVDVETESQLLSANSTELVLLTVVTDVTSLSGTYMVLVELFEESLSGALKGTAQREFRLYPVGRYQLALEANRTSVVTLENTTASFTVTVTSSSNNPTAVELNVSSTLGWSVEFSPDSVTLQPGGSMEITVKVHVPHNEQPGARDTVEVIVTSLRNETAFKTVSLSVIVELQVYALSIVMLDTVGALASGQSVELRGYVINLGNNVDNVTLESTPPAGWTVGFQPEFLLLDRGTTGLFVATVTAPPEIPGSGYVQVNLTARSQGVVETSTTPVSIYYNTAELTLDAKNITVEPDVPAAGKEMTLRVKVLNNGTVDAMGVEVTLLVSGVRVANDTVTRIPVGDVGTASLTWTPGHGWHLLEVMVDPEDRISESREDDNTATRNVRVFIPDLVVEPADIVLDPSYPTEGEDAVVRITVHNNRPLAVGPFDILLTIDDGTEETLVVEEGLEGEDNVTVEHTWTAVVGRHAFRVEVDPTGQVMEEDKDNNVATRTIPVNMRPLANLSVHQGTAYVDEEVTMDASDSSDPDGRVRQYFFDYGDGSDSGWTFQSVITHVYKSTGEYEVRLYVRDEANAQCDEPSVAAVIIDPVPTEKEESPGPATTAVALVLVIVALVLRRGRFQVPPGRFK